MIHLFLLLLTISLYKYTTAGFNCIAKVLLIKLCGCIQVLPVLFIIPLCKYFLIKPKEKNRLSNI